MRRLKNALSQYAVLFNFHDDKAKGRVCMVSASVLQSIIATFTGGVFYTTFLILNGINIVNVGIIAFVPYIANCFSVFSPSILERFKTRRWLLAGGRLAYYTLNIIGITLLPLFARNEGARLVCFVIIVFLANVINALFSSGYTVWHVNFLPNEIRADFFAANTLLVNVFNSSFALIASFVADALKGTQSFGTAIVVMRYMAYALAFAELFILTRPREYPYATSGEKPRFKDIFVKSFREKKFFRTMCVVAAYALLANLPAGVLDYHLLQNVGILYKVIWTINITYIPFIMLLQPLAKRLVARAGWIRVYALSLIAGSPMLLMYACVTGENYLWLWVTLRFLQHVTGVFFAITSANMPYINLPERDQTNYISFYTLIVNIATFVGQVLGTSYVALLGDGALTLWGARFGSVQQLLALEGVLALTVGLVTLKSRRSLSPEGG